MCQSLFLKAEDGIRDAQESRGLGDVYKRQIESHTQVQHIKIRDHILANNTSLINAYSKPIAIANKQIRNIQGF